MTSTATCRPAAAESLPTATPARRRVVDAPTRLFHWLFALCFLGAYLTADGERWRAVHVTLGTTMIALLLFRVLYGAFGPRQAGLGMLWRKLAAAPAWLRQAAGARTLSGVNWRQGQNLLMALAVVALLLMAVPLTVSGYATYNEWGGSLGGEVLEEVHEFFGQTFLALVLVHLAAIAALSLLRRKNQALPMLTGHVEGSGPDLVRQNRGWLAALLLLAVLGFAAWQWQQFPDGAAAPGQRWSSALDHRSHDDDD
jgi:cytochrome b